MACLLIATGICLLPLVLGLLFQTLIEHWDGTQWSFITTPPPPPNVVYRAFGIAVASANDIWMVGDSAHEQNPSYQTLTEFYC